MGKYRYLLSTVHVFAASRSAELQERHDNKDFQATAELYLCYNGLLSVLGLIQCFSLLVEVGDEL